MRVLNARGAAYPNLYIMLIAPPGAGKTQAENVLNPLLRDITNISAQHISKASLIDELHDNVVIRQISMEEKIEYHHAIILTSEFTETFEGYDTHLLGTLSRWWDCPDHFRERKRHLKEAIEMRNICCNMLAGVQPTMLAHNFPIQAWTGGFLARTIFVYEPHGMDILLWDIEDAAGAAYQDSIDDKAYNKLVTDLSAITQMVGTMVPDESYFKEYLRWKETDKQQPRPRHPRLFDYLQRREHNLVKLSMISAASRGNMSLEGKDFFRARTWLEDTEANLDDVFIEMATSDELTLMKDLQNFLWTITKGGSKPALRSRVFQFLAGKVPTQRLHLFLDAAKEAGFIQEQFSKDGTFRLYKPGQIDKMED